jgi:hypothetical protein
MLGLGRGRPSSPFVAKRVRTPTVVQQEAVECGAAALGIVLAYHGRIVPLEELRVACGVSRDGAKASNIVKAARTYGLEATGMRTETSGLAKSPLPAIVFWNFSHFLVIEGAGSRGVWVNDPAVGPRRVSWNEFAESYTGIVLEFTPGRDFEPGGSRPRLVSALAARLSVVAAAPPILGLFSFFFPPPPPATGLRDRRPRAGDTWVDRARIPEAVRGSGACSGR